MPWPPTGTVACNDPELGGDLLFTGNLGDKIATPRTRLDRKMDRDENAATLR